MDTSWTGGGSLAAAAPAAAFAGRNSDNRNQD